MTEIKSPEMYDALLKRAWKLMNAEVDSYDEQVHEILELKILTELIEEYEDKHYPIEVKE
jgi:antitoxin component HigA of HigAB toxin-antitoxin module